MKLTVYLDLFQKLIEDLNDPASNLVLSATRAGCQVVSLHAGLQSTNCTPFFCHLFFIPFFNPETNLFRANYCSVFQPASLKDVSRSINEIAELTAIAKS